MKSVCQTKLCIFHYRCIPEDNNIANERNQRSQEDLTGSRIPNWEWLAIAALVIGVLFLLVLTISLVRHVSRLKKRLRHSAEVLVPSGTILTTTMVANGNGHANGAGSNGNVHPMHQHLMNGNHNGHNGHHNGHNGHAIT